MSDWFLEKIFNQEIDDTEIPATKAVETPDDVELPGNVIVDENVEIPEFVMDDDAPLIPTSDSRLLCICSYSVFEQSETYRVANVTETEVVVYDKKRQKHAFPLTKTEFSLSYEDYFIIHSESKMPTEPLSDVAWMLNRRKSGFVFYTGKPAKDVYVLSTRYKVKIKTKTIFMLDTIGKIPVTTRMTEVTIL